MKKYRLGDEIRLWQWQNGESKPQPPAADYRNH
jgi:hypothetical protein